MGEDGSGTQYLTEEEFREFENELDQPTTSLDSESAWGSSSHRTHSLPANRHGKTTLRTARSTSSGTTGTGSSSSATTATATANNSATSTKSTGTNTTTTRSISEETKQVDFEKMSRHRIQWLLVCNLLSYFVCTFKNVAEGYIHAKNANMGEAVQSL